MSDLEWECTPQKGLQARPCPHRRLPFRPLPGAPLPEQPWRRIGVHEYAPGRAHESYFDLRQSQMPDVDVVQLAIDTIEWTRGFVVDEQGARDTWERGVRPALDALARLVSP